MLFVEFRVLIFFLVVFSVHLAIGKKEVALVGNRQRKVIEEFLAGNEVTG